MGTPLPPVRLTDEDLSQIEGFLSRVHIEEEWKGVAPPHKAFWDGHLYYKGCGIAEAILSSQWTRFAGKLGMIILMIYLGCSAFSDAVKYFTKGQVSVLWEIFVTIWIAMSLKEDR